MLGVYFDGKMYLFQKRPKGWEYYFKMTNKKSNKIG